MDFVTALDIARIVAYAIAAISMAFLAIDDYHQGRRTDIAWAALAMQNLAVLALLAMDLSAAVAWMEQRWMLTPFAIVNAVAIPYVAFSRAREYLDTWKRNRGRHERATS